MFILFVMFISCSGFLTKTQDVIGLLSHALSGSGSTLFILYIAPILPYGMSFAWDLEDRASPFWVIRTGVREYAISKFISSAIAGFLSVTISIILFTLIMSKFFPLFKSISNGNPYAALLENNRPSMYIFAIAVHYALSAALFAGGAITVSAFIPNKFSVIATPIVIYFVLMRLTDKVLIPDVLKISFLVQGFYPNVSPFEAFMYKLIPIIVLLGILLMVTVKQITKRMVTS
jgi:hypothetical protein